MNAQAPALLSLDCVTVRRRHDVLLDNISLAVARGTIHGVFGPNGAGKSTLLAAVLGRVPFDGRIELHWTGSGRIGYVPQSFPIDPTLPLTVEDFFALTRQRRPVCLGIARSARRHVAGLLEGMRLGSLARRPLAVLSGGELRRVLLAHALDPTPELLILDEPSTGLDETSDRWLNDVLSGLRADRRVTTLVVSHDVDQLRQLADAVTVLDRRIVAEGTPSELADRLDGAAGGWWSSRRRGEP